MDEVVVAAMRMMVRSDADPVAVSVACEAVIAWAHARQLEAIQQVSEESPEFFDPSGVLVEPASAEIGCALHWSAGAASRRVDLAATVCTELPGLLAALHGGVIDLGKAEEIVRGTCELDPGDRSLLADRAIDYAGGHTRAQLRAWLARQVAAIDPEAVARRRKKALRARRVWVQPEPDGMATIGAYLSAEEAQACLNALTAGAANIDGAVDAARADVFVALITGLAVGQPVQVQVILTPGPPELAGAELAGHGPISPCHSAELCAGADLIDLSAKPKPSTGYRPAPALARWVRTRDRHCRFPGCRRPATMCDLDHVNPWPAGATHDANLAVLCRYHHRLKTHTPGPCASNPAPYWPGPAHAATPSTPPPTIPKSRDCGLRRADSDPESRRSPARMPPDIGLGGSRHCLPAARRRGTTAWRSPRVETPGGRSTDQPGMVYPPIGANTSPL